MADVIRAGARYNRQPRAPGRRSDLEPGAARTTAMAIGELSGSGPAPDRRRLAAGVLAVGLGALLMVVLSALGAPTTLSVFAAAALVGIGLLTRPQTATLMFIAVLYLNLPVVAARFHGAPDVVLLAPSLLLMVPFLSYLVIRRQQPVITPTLFAVIGYLIVLLLSSAFSADPAAAAEQVAVFASEGLLLYVLVTNAVRSWDTVQKTVLVLLVAGTIMGGLSLFQEVTQTYDNQYWGLAQTKEADPDEPIEPGDRPRLSGPIGSKNRYAQVMLVLLPLALFAYLTGRTRRYRFFAVVAGVAIMAGMLLTFSRGAGVALGALVLIAVALRSIRLRNAVLVTAALVAATLVVTPQYVERIGSLTEVGSLVDEGSGDAPDGAILGRATSNLASLNVFMDYPILGVGPGQYSAAYSQEYANELGLRHFFGSRRAHNLVLEVAADTGIAGVLAFVGIFGTTLIGLWRARRRWLHVRPEYAGWATAFFLAVLGYLASSMFLHLSYARYFWLLIALANSVAWILMRQPVDAEERPEAA